MIRTKTRGNSLVGLMVTVVIIAILSVVFLKGGCGSNLAANGGSTRKDGKGTTIPGAVKARAQDTVCISNLGQVRMSIEVAESSDSEAPPPASLSDLRLPAEVLRCPIGHEPYVYDPATGKVRCVHPGHEKY